MRFTLTHTALGILHQHATIHERLDRFDRHYRDLLMRIEKEEIKSYGSERKYRKLEELKQELLEIRFLD